MSNGMPGSFLNYNAALLFNAADGSSWRSLMAPISLNEAATGNLVSMGNE